MHRSLSDTSIHSSDPGNEGPPTVESQPAEDLEVLSTAMSSVPGVRAPPSNPSTRAAAVQAAIMKLTMDKVDDDGKDKVDIGT